MTVEELQAQLDAEREQHAQELAAQKEEHTAEIERLNAEHAGALDEQRKIIDKLMTRSNDDKQEQGEKSEMQRELEKINKKRGY